MSTIPTPSGSCWCMDQLNIHSPASLYQAFPPAEAKRLADKLEIHHTPKHGSWLNMAEIELSVLQRQCLTGGWRPGHDGAGGHRLGSGTQRTDRRHRLALHHRRCPHQAQNIELMTSFKNSRCLIRGSGIAYG